MRPDISVILPIFNTERYLEQCLTSVCEQTLKSIEIICVDDGSTDDSPRIMDSFARRDPRVKVIHKENGGYGKAVNFGISQATGEYIAIVEPDDYVDTTMYEKLHAKVIEFDRPDIVKAAYWRVYNPDTKDQKILPAFYYHRVEHTDVLFTLDQDAEFLYHHPSIWTALYKRSFLRDFDIWMHEIPGAGWADNPWLIETLVQARSIVYLDECLYYYRESNTGSLPSVKDPSVIYQRWFDMDDIVRHLKVTSPVILEGHFNRACVYIDLLTSDFDPSDPEIRKAINDMIARTDCAVIVRSKKILPYLKVAYLSQAGTLNFEKHPLLTAYHAARIAKHALQRLMGRRG